MSTRLGLLLGLVFSLSVLGCGKKNKGTDHPDAPRTVMAEPATYDGVLIDESYLYEEAPEENPEAVGYETTTDGDKVVVIEYVHTYPEAVETFPRVYWSGRWYYNVHGDFVWYSDYYGGWCYYWGPPAPLVVGWNAYYPWAPYTYAVGYYGPGWYWGGVGVYGYHAYGLPVVHQHHHHYDRRPGVKGAGTPHPPSAGGPTGNRPSPGGPAGGPTRTVTNDKQPPRRTAPGSRNGGNGPTRTTPGARNGGNAPRRTAPVRNSMTTKGGQKVTRVDPSRSTTSPSTAPRRDSKTIGRVTNGRNDGPARTRTKVPSWTSKPSRTSPSPSWGPTHASGKTNKGSRSFSAPSRPSRTATPTSPSRSSRPTPSFSAPNRGSSPSRSSRPSSSYRPKSTRSSPTRSRPSRSSSGSRSYSPSRSSSPRPSSGSRSYGGSSRSSRPSPSRSAPSRSSGSRSSGSRSSGSRSSGSRSSGGSRSGGSRGPSRSGGGRRR